MFMYNGTDYTLYVIFAVSAVILFALQYFLCVKAQRRVVKLLPWAYVVLLLGLAVASIVTYDGGGFIDLSGLLAILLCCYAAICAAAILLALLVYRLRRRRIK